MLNNFRYLYRSKLFTIAALLILATPVLAADGEVEKAVDAYQNGNYQQAVELWRQQVETGDSVELRVIALNNLANTYLKLNRLDLANTAIDKSLKLVEGQERVSSSTYAQTLLVAGNVRDSSGQTGSAIKLWQNAKELYRGEDPTGYIKTSLNLLRGYSNEGHYNRLGKELEELETFTSSNDIQDNSLSVRSLLVMGNTYRLIGNDELAQTKIERAIELENNVETRLALANLYKYKGEYDKAEIELDSLIAARRNVNSQEDRYRIQLERQQLALSQNDLVKVARIGRELLTLRLPLNNQTLAWQLTNADNLITSNHRGLRWQVLENNLTELKAKAEGLNSNRHKALALHHLARVSQKRGNRRQAIALAKESLAADSLNENYQTYWILTQSHQALGEYEEAIALNQRTIETINKIKGNLVTNPEFQIRFNSETRPIYDNLVALAIDRPDGASQEDLKVARDAIESLQIVELENYFRLACLESEPKEIGSLDPKSPNHDFF